MENVRCSGLQETPAGLFLENGGAESYLDLLLDLLLGGRSGVADVLKVMALSWQAGVCVCVCVCVSLSVF